jgi:hypothetical protein
LPISGRCCRKRSTIKPLKPDDFPVEIEGKELVTADGKPIAKAKTPAIAEDIADRLNEDDCRKEQDRWSA